MHDQFETIREQRPHGKHHVVGPRAIAVPTTSRTFCIVPPFVGRSADPLPCDRVFRRFSSPAESDASLDTGWARWPSAATDQARPGLTPPGATFHPGESGGPDTGEDG